MVISKGIKDFPSKDLLDHKKRFPNWSDNTINMYLSKLKSALIDETFTGVFICSLSVLYIIKILLLFAIMKAVRP